MKKDMTVGNPLGLIIAFAIPLFASNLFQQFYNIADTAIVGHVLGDHALASVGSVSIIYSLITSLCFGMSTGFSILIAQYFGAQNEKMLQKTIATTLKLAIYISVFMTVVCLAGLKWFMSLINVSDELFADGYAYISIIVAGLVVSVLYNMLSSVLRALGNSTIPLIFLIISSILNIGLDFLFIKGLGLGIGGAAYATILAQLISVLLCVIYILVFNRDILPPRKAYKTDMKLIGSMLTSGFSMALMYAIVNVGTVVLQSGINGFEEDVVAAHMTARKISEICMMPISTFSTTMVTFCGQNYGSGKMDRVIKGIGIATALGLAVASLEIIAIHLAGRQLVVALTGTQSEFIIGTASRYLNVNLNFYYPLVVLCILRSSLQGIDRKGITVFGSALEMICKVLVVAFLVKPYGYTAIIYCEPIIWIICCIPVGVAFFTDRNILSTLRK